MRPLDLALKIAVLTVCALFTLGFLVAGWVVCGDHLKGRRGKARS